MDMIKARKEELQKRGKKGFTLMEMLIVVAIIAILIAIAIPVFTTQLNKSKQAADEANARSLYAVATANYMTDTASYKAPTISGSVATYQGTTYCFSDKCSIISVGQNQSTSAPTITVKTNDVTTSFGQ